MWRIRAGLVGVLALAVLCGVLMPMTARASDPQPYEGSEFYEPPASAKGAVASVHSGASKIGIDVLAHGGNAMDAAVAMAFALGVLRAEENGRAGSPNCLWPTSRRRAPAFRLSHGRVIRATRPAQDDRSRELQGGLA